MIVFLKLGNSLLDCTRGFSYKLARTPTLVNPFRKVDPRRLVHPARSLDRGLHPLYGRLDIYRQVARPYNLRDADP